RVESDGISLTTAVPWDSILEATVDGEAREVDTLRENFAELVTGQDTLGEFEIGGDLRFVEPRLVQVNQSRAVALEIVDVRLANLDRDAAADGFLVSFVLFDEQGQPVEARGNLSAQLWTERRPWRAARQSERERFRREESWTQRIQPSDFVDGVFTARLRFRHLEPQEEFDLLPEAELTLRYSAYGHGNFAASVPVCLRPYDRYRDRRQHAVGDRYVPRELPGVIGRKHTSRTDGLWLAWP
ncbi:MAG: hypothetical protein RID07_10035, partial [Lacipirellulaceae bacterium]